MSPMEKQRKAARRARIRRAKIRKRKLRRKRAQEEATRFRSKLVPKPVVTTSHVSTLNIPIYGGDERFRTVVTLDSIGRVVHASSSRIVELDLLSGDEVFAFEPMFGPGVNVVHSIVADQSALRIFILTTSGHLYAYNAGCHNFAPLHRVAIPHGMSLPNVPVLSVDVDAGVLVVNSSQADEHIHFVEPISGAPIQSLHISDLGLQPPAKIRTPVYLSKSMLLLFATSRSPDGFVYSLASNSLVARLSVPAGIKPSSLIYLPRLEFVAMAMESWHSSFTCLWPLDAIEAASTLDDTAVLNPSHTLPGSAGAVLDATFLQSANVLLTSGPDGSLNVHDADPEFFVPPPAEDKLVVKYLREMQVGGKDAATPGLAADGTDVVPSSSSPHNPGDVDHHETHSGNLFNASLPNLLFRSPSAIGLEALDAPDSNALLPEPQLRAFKRTASDVDLHALLREEIPLPLPEPDTAPARFQLFRTINPSTHPITSLSTLRLSAPSASSAPPAPALDANDEPVEGTFDLASLTNTPGDELVCGIHSATDSCLVMYVWLVKRTTVLVRVSEFGLALSEEKYATIEAAATSAWNSRAPHHRAHFDLAFSAMKAEIAAHASSSAQIRSLIKSSILLRPHVADPPSHSHISGVHELALRLPHRAWYEEGLLQFISGGGLAVEELFFLLSTQFKLPAPLRNVDDFSRWIDSLELTFVAEMTRDIYVSGGSFHESRPSNLCATDTGLQIVLHHADPLSRAVSFLEVLGALFAPAASAPDEVIPRGLARHPLDVRYHLWLRESSRLYASLLRLKNLHQSRLGEFQLQALQRNFASVIPSSDLQAPGIIPFCGPEARQRFQFGFDSNEITDVEVDTNHRLLSRGPSTIVYAGNANNGSLPVAAMVMDPVSLRAIVGVSGASRTLTASDHLDAQLAVHRSLYQHPGLVVAYGDVVGSNGGQGGASDGSVFSSSVGSSSRGADGMSSRLRQRTVLYDRLADYTPLSLVFERCGFLGAPRDWDIVALWGAQMATLLGATSELSVVLRNINPSSIFVSPTGDSVVLGSLCDMIQLAPSAHSASGYSVVSHPSLAPDLTARSNAYLPPEHFDPETFPLTPAYDVFCLGVVLYHMLFGVPPPPYGLAPSGRGVPSRYYDPFIGLPFVPDPSSSKAAAGSASSDDGDDVSASSNAMDGGGNPGSTLGPANQAILVSRVTDGDPAPSIARATHFRLFAGAGTRESALGRDLLQVIALCLQPDPKARPTPAQLLAHPLFAQRVAGKGRTEEIKLARISSARYMENQDFELLVEQDMWTRIRVMLSAVNRAGQLDTRMFELQLGYIEHVAEFLEDETDLLGSPTGGSRGSRSSRGMSSGAASSGPARTLPPDQAALLMDEIVRSGVVDALGVLALRHMSGIRDASVLEAYAAFLVRLLEHPGMVDYRSSITNCLVRIYTGKERSFTSAPVEAYSKHRDQHPVGSVSASSRGLSVMGSEVERGYLPSVARADSSESAWAGAGKTSHTAITYQELVYELEGMEMDAVQDGAEASRSESLDAPVFGSVGASAKTRASPLTRFFGPGWYVRSGWKQHSEPDPNSDLQRYYEEEGLHWSIDVFHSLHGVVENVWSPGNIRVIGLDCEPEFDPQHALPFRSWEYFESLVRMGENVRNLALEGHKHRRQRRSGVVYMSTLFLSRDPNALQHLVDFHVVDRVALLLDDPDRDVRVEAVTFFKHLAEVYREVTDELSWQVRLLLHAFRQRHVFTGLVRRIRSRGEDASTKVLTISTLHCVLVDGYSVEGVAIEVSIFTILAGLVLNTNDPAVDSYVAPVLSLFRALFRVGNPGMLRALELTPRLLPWLDKVGVSAELPFAPRKLSVEASRLLEKQGMLPDEVDAFLEPVFTLFAHIEYYSHIPWHDPSFRAITAVLVGAFKQYWFESLAQCTVAHRSSLASGKVDEENLSDMIRILSSILTLFSTMVRVGFDELILDLGVLDVVLSLFGQTDVVLDASPLRIHPLRSVMVGLNALVASLLGTDHRRILERLVTYNAVALAVTTLKLQYGQLASAFELHAVEVQVPVFYAPERAFRIAVWRAMVRSPLPQVRSLVLHSGFVTYVLTTLLPNVSVFQLSTTATTPEFEPFNWHLPFRDEALELLLVLISSASTSPLLFQQLLTLLRKHRVLDDELTRLETSGTTLVESSVLAFIHTMLTAPEPAQSELTRLLTSTGTLARTVQYCKLVTRAASGSDGSSTSGSVDSMTISVPNPGGVTGSHLGGHGYDHHLLDLQQTAKHILALQG